MPHRLTHRAVCAACASIGVWLALGSGALVAQEPERRPVVVDELPHSALELDEFRGRWRYVYSTRRPAIPADAANRLADAIRDARSGAPEHAIAWMVREEEGLRMLAADGGRAAVDFAETYTMRVDANGDFYERRDVDGGWQAESTRGSTTQLLVTGDTVLHRVDVSDANVSSPFYAVVRDAAQHRWDRCLLLLEWFDHAEMLAYALEYGEEQGDRHVVTPERFLARPPYGVGCPLVGNRVVAQVRRDGPRLSAIVTLFDGTGRTCKEWRNTWVDGRPIELVSRSYFSAGATVDSERRIQVLERDLGGPLPDVHAIASMPFERRECEDMRTEHPTMVDPVVDADRLIGAAVSPEAVDTAGPTIAEAAPPSTVLPESRSGAAPLARIPSRTGASSSGASPSGASAWPWFVAFGVLAAVLFVVAARRRSVASGLTALVLCAAVTTSGCGPAAAGSTVRSIGDAVASPAAAAGLLGDVEFAPASRRVDVGAPGLRRFEWHALNTSAETVEVTAVLPSCGCVEVRRSRDTIEPFGSVPLEVVVDTARFRPVTIRLQWRSASGRSGEAVARLDAESSATAKG